MTDDTPIATGRRRFLKSLATGAAAFTAGSIAGPVLGKGVKHHWKLVTAWPKNFPGLGTGANFLAEQIQTLSGGQIKVSVYGAGEIVPAFEVFDAVSRGTAQMGHGVSYYWKGKTPAAQFLAGVPFGLTGQEMNAWLYDGDGLKLWEETYAPFDLIPFPVGNTGVQMGGWFNKEINSITDLKGLKMRIPGLGAEVIKRAGGTPVTIPGGEIFTALKTGTIDALEWAGPYNDLAFGLYRAAKYYYYPGWHEPGTAIEAFVNKNAFEALTPQLQHIVRAAARVASCQMSANFTAQNAQALQTLVNVHKVQLRRFPEAVLNHLAQISQQVISDIASQDAMAKKVYQSYQAFLKKEVAYHNVSELAYLQARLQAQQVI